MKYSNVISEMVWSYSRIKTFELCPYQFLLSYIKKPTDGEEEVKTFFTEYGSFMHKILELYLDGQLKRGELVSYYVTNFRKNIKGFAPKQTTFETYFTQGLQYLSNIDFPYRNLIGIEQRVVFFIGDKKFQGVIDCIAKDDNDLILLDHKSRTLKEWSKKEIPTKSDMELIAYLRQLYMYCIPIKELFGVYPSRLEFNCFRSNQMISEPFNHEDFEKTKEWALSQIAKITDNDDWSPRMEYWKCRHLCSQRDRCEYFSLNR